MVRKGNLLGGYGNNTELYEDVAEQGVGLISRPAGVLAAGAKEYVRSGREEDEIKRRFGNSAPQGLMRATKARWKGRMREAAVSAGGAAAGATIGTVLFPGVGTAAGWAVGAAGGLAGGIAADKAYNYANPWYDSNAFRLAQEADAAQAEGQEIPREVVLAILSPHLPDRLGNEINKAYIKGDMKKLQELTIRSDSYLRAKTGMPIDYDDPSKTVVDQFAELINNGQIPASEILAANPHLLVQLAQDQQAGYADMPMDPLPPVTPVKLPPGRGKTPTA